MTTEEAIAKVKESAKGSAESQDYPTWLIAKCSCGCEGWVEMRPIVVSRVGLTDQQVTEKLCRCMGRFFALHGITEYVSLAFCWWAVPGSGYDAAGKIEEIPLDDRTFYAMLVIDKKGARRIFECARVEFVKDSVHLGPWEFSTEPIEGAMIIPFEEVTDGSKPSDPGPTQQLEG
jgi:hypothetical protein